MKGTTMLEEMQMQQEDNLFEGVEEIENTIKY